MPNPVPLATKEEEERRTWVTAHHEVVQLIKDCFGDRFSNNEIFDRLKISRRTGYRALCKDERIGKAPGRKPKISEETITEMIDYIASGGCSEVGNVWKHLADKFAPDCNPKTVQDAVKKRGFHNHRDTVRLQPLLNQPVPGDGILPDELHSPIQGDSNGVLGPPAPQARLPELQQPLPNQQRTPQLPSQSGQPQMPPTPQTALDPTFHQQMNGNLIDGAIDNIYEFHARYMLKLICNQVPEASHLFTRYLLDSNDLMQQTMTESVPAMGAPDGQTEFQQQMGSFDSQPKRQRLAVCRRCQQPYDRVENTMDNRHCLYHKGAPQKISADITGTLQESPEAFIWSCCGGNGNVRGCCRAMHTTKKKRKYGKKRGADEAKFDMQNDENGDDTVVEDMEMDDVHMAATLEGLDSLPGMTNELLMQQMAELSSTDFAMQEGLPDDLRNAQLQPGLLRFTSGSA